MAAEPGLDAHEWQSEWASLDEEIRDSPETALPYLHELITRMLTERAVLGESLVALEGRTRTGSSPGTPAAIS